MICCEHSTENPVIMRRALDWCQNHNAVKPRVKKSHLRLVSCAYQLISLSNHWYTASRLASRAFFIVTPMPLFWCHEADTAMPVFFVIPGHKVVHPLPGRRFQNGKAAVVVALISYSLTAKWAYSGMITSPWGLKAWVQDPADSDCSSLELTLMLHPGGKNLPLRVLLLLAVFGAVSVFWADFSVRSRTHCINLQHAL